LARRPLAGEAEADVEVAGYGSTFAVGLLALVALSLPALPTLAAVGLLAFPTGWLAAVLGCLGAAVTGVKLIAMAWALGARLSAMHRAGGAVVFSD
jgi:hypothetical protein